MISSLLPQQSKLVGVNKEQDISIFFFSDYHFSKFCETERNAHGFLFLFVCVTYVGLPGSTYYSLFFFAINLSEVVSSTSIIVGRRLSEDAPKFISNAARIKHIGRTLTKNCRIRDVFTSVRYAPLSSLPLASRLCRAIRGISVYETGGLSKILYDPPLTSQEIITAETSRMAGVGNKRRIGRGPSRPSG